MPTASIPTPVGWIRVTEQDGHLTRLDWGQGQDETTPLLEETREQLLAYFDRALDRFDLPLNPKGGELHQAVFQAMLDIPFGQTRTYGEIAKELDTYGQPVGQACGANPIPLIIPCHRVLSATGLGGYSGSGGLDTKI
ncbi:MAG: methylated-DNA--[protein]-cysteine S-methyltransferase, partial [Roseibium sp.]